MQPLKIPGIPEQKIGSFHDSESRRDFDDSESTIRNFEILKNHFYAINLWKNFCDGKSAEFKLFDSAGNPVDGIPKENDLIRIDIQGPGNPESGGYEWAKINKIATNEISLGEIESIVLSCIPTTIPAQTKNKHISHFYSEHSSSTFKISRGSNFIKIGIYGRNETPNMNTDFRGKIRNWMIALGGMLGMSKIQWKVFADKMIELD